MEENHPYGYNTKRDMIQNIHVTEIRHHYHEHYLVPVDLSWLVVIFLWKKKNAYIESSLGGISLKAKSSISYPNAETSNVPIFENRTMGRFSVLIKSEIKAFVEIILIYTLFIANAILEVFNSRLSQVIRRNKV